MNPINLSGFQYTGNDVIERLTRAFQPLIEHSRQNTSWFQTEVILPALVNGIEIQQIVRGLARYAQFQGFQVQGVEGLRVA